MWNCLVVNFLLLLPTVYRLIACFSSHPCLCLALWKVASPSFSGPSSAPSYVLPVICPLFFFYSSVFCHTFVPFFLSLQYPSLILSIPHVCLMLSLFTLSTSVFPAILRAIFISVVPNIPFVLDVSGRVSAA